MKWKVYFFQTVRGDYPVKDFTDGLDKATQTKIANILNC